MRPRLGRRMGPAVLPTVVLIVLGYLVLVPLVIVALAAARLSEGRFPFDPRSPWSFGNITAVFTDERTYGLLMSTVVLSVGSLVIALGVSLVAAWLIERTDVPLRGMFKTMIIAGIGIPSFIFAITWSLLGNPSNGMVNLLIRGVLPFADPGPVDIFSLGGMIFVLGLSLVPVTFLLLSAAVQALDATLEDAASMSGANPARVGRTIVLPLLTPAILGAFIYQFATAMESLDVPLVLGLRRGIVVLPTEIYLQAQPTVGLPNYGLSSTYGILLILTIVIPLVYYQRIVGRSERYATVSGKGYRSVRRALSARTRALATTFLSLYCLVALIIPTLVLLYVSLQPYYSLPSWDSLARTSLDAFRSVLSMDLVRDAFGNTVLLGLLTGFLSITIGGVVSWVIVRGGPRLRKIVDTLAFIPHSVPAIVMGLSVALIYLYLRSPIYGTVFIIVIALMTRYMALATRQMNSALGGIQRELEEASSMAGARPHQTFLRILFPLTSRAYANGFLLVFLLSVQNLAIPLLLSGRESVVLSTVIWRRWDSGDTSGTAALSVLMVTFTIVAATIAHVAGRGKWRVAS